MEDAIKFAVIAEAKKLLFTHHDPARTDDQLQGILKELKSEYCGQLDFDFAREGMEIEMG
jgi:ribonuclease BN (tRNA processing enzyme)